MLRKLEGDQQREIILELSSHLYDSIGQDAAEREAERVLNAVERLGPPEEYLRPLVADRLVEHASRSFNPLSVGRGLGLHLLGGLKQGALALLFSVGYLCVFILLLMPLFKVLWSAQVGLFTYPNGDLVFGFFASTLGATEHLGYWIVPLALAGSLLLYTVLTKLLVVLKT